MHSCSRKYSMVTKRGSTQKRKMSESEEKTNMVEVVTQAQVARLAAWSRTAARAVQPKAVNSCASLPLSPFCPKLQASGVLWSMADHSWQTQNVGFTCGSKHVRPGFPAPPGG